MVTTIEDLDMPRAIIVRLVKSVLPDGFGISSDSKLAITKATTVFISYIAAMASDVAKSTGHKTITVQHVYKALEEAEFEEYITQIMSSMDGRTKQTRLKKTNTTDQSKPEENVAKANSDNDDLLAEADDSLNAKTRNAGENEGGNDEDDGDDVDEEEEEVEEEEEEEEAVDLELDDDLSDQSEGEGAALSSTTGLPQIDREQPQKKRKTDTDMELSEAELSDDDD
ncbi:hypothetical protein H4R33_000631 [Dimargaris cristalligena]|nr:hypothetical protein H4R33_000631 [Dimargaris cristalligena]